MDWFNTQFYRDYGYGLLYPQIFPHHKRERRSSSRRRRLGQGEGEGLAAVLNDHWLGPNNKYWCGDQITIADYFGAAIMTAGELSTAISRAIPTSSAGSPT